MSTQTKDKVATKEATNPKEEEEAKALWDKMFQSRDSTADFLRDQLFRSGDSLGGRSESASFLNSILKSTESLGGSSALFQSQARLMETMQRQASVGSEAAFIANITKSMESVKKGERPSEGLLDDIRKSADSFKNSDVFKSALGSMSGVSVPGAFTSSDWVPKYEPKHVDVDITGVFQSSSASEPARKPRTNWAEMYESTLPPQELATNQASLEAASALASLKPAMTAQDEERSIAKSEGKNSSQKKREGRKRKVYEPDEKVYTEPQKNDVLMGRGGRTNHHPGNQMYLIEKEKIQPKYMAADKNEKTTISQELVDLVTAWGGRFLKLDEEQNKWYEVHNTVARKKASQTLREVNTAEERAAKRARYKQ